MTGRRSINSRVQRQGVLALGTGAKSQPQKALSSAVRAGSGLESHLAQSVAAAGLPAFESEYRFHPTRLWRIDLAFVEQKLAVEIEGGIYRGGGHTSVTGIKRDIAKANALTLLGWRLLRFHGDQVKSGEATETIRQALRDGLVEG